MVCYLFSYKARECLSKFIAHPGASFKYFKAL